MIVFDLKKIQVHILDNMKGCIVENYGLVPKRIITYFSSYLTELGHPHAAKINLEVARVARLNWQTNTNAVDCAIFVMRHMECFTGGIITKFECGFFC